MRSEEHMVRADCLRANVQLNKTEQREGSEPASPSPLAKERGQFLELFLQYGKRTHRGYRPCSLARCGEGVVSDCKRLSYSLRKFWC